MNAPVRQDEAVPSIGDTGTRAPLRECVREALDVYLTSLGDHDAHDLFRLVMHEVEIPMLQAVLAHTRGNQSRAAQMLGINRGTLRKKLRLYGLE
jgi:Fis family transcriptional regulator